MAIYELSDTGIKRLQKTTFADVIRILTGEQKKGGVHSPALVAHRCRRGVGIPLSVHIIPLSVHEFYCCDHF